MFSSQIEIKAPKEEIESYFNALAPEEGFKTERAGYKLKRTTGRLVVEIKAEDATAFRAVTNTIAGLISIVEKTIKEAKHGR